MKDRKSKKLKRKLVTAALAVTTAASVLVAGLFRGPEEILQDPENGKPVIVYQLDEEDEEEESLSGENEKKKKKFFSRIKALLMRLPVLVKMLLVLPLWLLGFGITQLVKTLLKLILTPLLTALLTWLLTAFILLLLFYALCRLLFPAMTAREILSGQNIAAIYAASALCCLGNLLLGRFSEDFEENEMLFRFLEGLLILSGLLIKTALQQRRKRKESAASLFRINQGLSRKKA